MLESINLSLSSLCGADCIFCPSDRGDNIKKKVMPFKYAKKIIDELASEKFKKIHKVRCIELGENGDALLNKDFIRIVRYIKLKLPNTLVELYNNFGELTKEKLELILKERLIDSFVCNIDGSNEKNYFNVKRINLKKVNNNLKDFVKIRKSLKSNVPLAVRVLTLHNFIHSIKKNFGFLPSKLKDPSLAKVPDDFPAIKKQLERTLNMKIDGIVKSGTFAWTERDKIDLSKIDYKKCSCPVSHKVRKQAFISPDGKWYACCLDSRNQLIIGDVIKESINDLFFSKRRKELIRLLKEKRFTEIGGPCKTVNCCQWLPLLN